MQSGIDWGPHRYIFCTEVRSKGAENSLTIHEISAALTSVTPKVTKLPSLLPLIRQRIIKSKVKIRSSNVSVLIKEGVFFTGKNVSVFEKRGPFLA